MIQDTASTARSLRCCARASGRRATARLAADCRRAGAADASTSRTCAQLRREGRAARRIRARQPAIDSHGRRSRHASRRARGGDRNRRRGRPRPCAVVATAGTTTTTAIDPIEGIAAMARRQHGLWLHVDAAMAGSAMILPECRWMWEGIEGGGFAGHQSAQVARRRVRLLDLLRARRRASGARDVDEPELPAHGSDGQARNYRDWGIPLGRRFRALKLWFLIREQGVAGLQVRLRRDIEQRAMARGAGATRRPAGAWLRPCRSRRSCVRHEPPGLEGEALDRHTLAWFDRINRLGRARSSRRPCSTGAGWCASRSARNPPSAEHVEALWALMRSEAEAGITRDTQPRRN